MLETFVETLIILNVCHWLGDFTHLSAAWMLSAKRLGKPLFPILVHAGVHTLLFSTSMYVMFGLKAAIITACIQLPTHFMIDVLKGRLNGWFPKLQDMANKFHWMVFGGDQFAHQIVIILTAYLLNK